MAPARARSRSATTAARTSRPAYEGWEEDADGTKYFVFGYMNRNWEEEIDVPVGPANGFSPGHADLGQPTRFLPRRNRFIFRVAVPPNVHREGRARVDRDDQWQDRKGLGLAPRGLQAGRRREGVGNRCARRRHEQPGGPREQASCRTVLGRKALRAKVGEPLTLASVVTDDGIPKRSSRGSWQRSRHEHPPRRQ